LPNHWQTRTTTGEKELDGRDWKGTLDWATVNHAPIREKIGKGTRKKEKGQEKSQAARIRAK